MAKLPKETPVETGQTRATTLGPIEVRDKYIGASGRWFGRWWVTCPTRQYVLEVWRTGEIQEYPVLVDG